MRTNLSLNLSLFYFVYINNYQMDALVREVIK
jgi:hypothetical protein